MDTSTRMSHLAIDTSLSSSTSRSPRPSLSRSPSSATFRKASPSNPFQALPPDPSFPARSYPAQSGKVGATLPWRSFTGVVPPNVKRVITKSPLLGLTILIVLPVVFFLFRSPAQAQTPTSPLSPTLLDTSPQIVESPKHDLAGDIVPINLPDLDAAHYIHHFPTLQLPTSILKLPLLAQRLHGFLNRPISSYTPVSEVHQHEQCPARLSDKLVNPDQFRGDRAFWLGVDAEEIAKRRAGVVQWFERRLGLGETVLGSEKTGTGRGIVLTGGNKDTTLRMMSVLRHLKRLKVDLPIEVFHYDDELRDEGQRRQIEELGAKVLVVHGLTKDAGAWKNWQIKGLAIVQSSFREVLYLDSDNTPLRDPTHLFDSPTYLNHGRAVFWPDLSKDHPDNAIWRIIGDQCSLSHWTFESGEIVIDKAGNDGLNLAALLIASDMQGDRDFWFHLSGGDKDTFRWGFRALGLPWGEPPRWMSALGILNQFDGGRFCGHTMLQYDLDVQQGQTRALPLFVHSNLLKHLGSAGLGRGSTFTHVKRISIDDISNPILNHAHHWVYQGPGRGMCLDLEWHESTEEERGGAVVETVDVGDIEGDVFRGFEDAFFEEGGRIGGW